MLEACRVLGGCPTGQARITPGCRLPARWVIHTVGPIWRGGSHGEPTLLASCYHESLSLAQSHGIQSIAFPAISTGIYGYPLAQATQIALGTVHAHPSRASIAVSFVCFDETAYACYAEAPARYRDSSAP